MSKRLHLSELPSLHLKTGDSLKQHFFYFSTAAPKKWQLGSETEVLTIAIPAIMSQ